VEDLWVERDVETWTHGHGLPAAAARAEEARLRRLGFQAAFAQNFQPVDQAPAAALCLVEQFRTSGAARAQVAEILAQADRLASVDRFAVPTIPGAKGFTATDATSSGTNVVFSVGRYTLRIAADGRSDSEPARSQIITAAQRLYRRVRDI
jgi:hypothetical protein